MRSYTAFTVWHTNILRACPSGKSCEDYARFATTLFNEDNVKSASKNVGPSFKFKLAYGEQSKHPKYVMALNEGSRGTKFDMNKSGSEDIFNSECVGATERDLK